MNWFDLVVLILIAVTLLRGFFSGLVMQAATLAGLILGAIFAGKLAEYLTPHILSVTNAPLHIMGPLSYILAFILILIILVLAGKALESLVDAVKLTILNRLAGAVFCAAKWLIILSILLNLVVELDKDKRIIREDIRTESYAYPLVSDLSKTVIPYLRFDWIE